MSKLKSSIACLSLAALLTAPAAPLMAQTMGKSLARGVAGVDAAAIRPVVQSVLDGDKPGATRPWHSDKGGGTVKLISGGAASGQACGTARTTSITPDGKSSSYVFRYCRDAKGQWRIAG